MSTTRLGAVALLGLGVGLGAGWAWGRGLPSQRAPQGAVAPAAQVPGHPEGHAGHDQAVASPPANGEATPSYTCPMHPQVLSARPGSCPICGMDLVLKAPANPEAGASSTAWADVALPPQDQVLAQVATDLVQARVPRLELKLPAQVVVDESRLSQVTQRFGGRVEDLAGLSEGQRVRVGQTVAWLNSPELAAAQAEHLSAWRSWQNMKALGGEAPAQAQALWLASGARLSVLGFGPAEQRALLRQGQVPRRVAIRSPHAGVVVRKEVQVGSEVAPGAPLLSLARMDRVWVEAQASQEEVALLGLGQGVQVQAPGRALPSQGRIAFIAPTVKADTRSATVRVVLPNPQGHWRPGMQATLEVLAQASPQALPSIPSSALVASGDGHLVYVQSAPGRFVAQRVALGPSWGEWVAVRAGLKVGDAVAVRGAFLLDASAQLRGGPHDKAGSAPKSAGHEGHTP